MDVGNCLDPNIQLHRPHAILLLPGQWQEEKKKKFKLKSQMDSFPSHNLL